MSCWVWTCKKTYSNQKIIIREQQKKRVQLPLKRRSAMCRVCRARIQDFNGKDKRISYNERIMNENEYEV